MKHTTEAAGSDPQNSVASAVQTSAQSGDPVRQQDPATGGSYVRNTNTGALVKRDRSPEQE